ncbi:MAG: hypothetical protein ACOWWO_05370 [Peptococcaceae bacterium]
MPISGEQFEKGVDDSNSIKGRISEFLKNNPDNAYTFDEIVKGTGIAEKANLKTLIYQFMLEGMVTEGVIDKKIISVHSYYKMI